MTVLVLTADKPFETSVSTIRLSTDAYAERIDELAKFVTLGLSTGACHVQTYLTAEQCRKLAAHLMQLAEEVEPIPVGAVSPCTADEFIAAMEAR